MPKTPSTLLSTLTKVGTDAARDAAAGEDEMLARCNAYAYRIDGAIGLLNRLYDAPTTSAEDRAILNTMRTQALVYVGYCRDLAARRISGVKTIRDHTLDLIDRFCTLVETELGTAGGDTAGEGRQ